MQLLKILAIGFLIVGCSTGSDGNRATINTDVKIVFVDQQGNNLLNPENQNTITEQNTNLYYLVNGEKQKVFEGTLDCPKQFCIEKSESSGTYYMQVFPNIIHGQNETITYIEFSDSSMDTIKVHYEDGRGYTYVTKVWYNHQLRWDNDADRGILRFKVTRAI